MMKQILDVYCFASSQEANLQKSGVFFSANTDSDTKEDVCSALGISSTDAPGLYLGIPAIWKRSKCPALSFIKDKVAKRVNSWKRNFLSFRGREVMIKSVISAIPAYIMNCFKLPLRTCRELDAMVSNFWWGQNKEGGKIHWVAWNKLTNSKNSGGLGFRDFSCFNLALLAKRAWRVLKCPNDPWVKILKGVYFPNGDFLTAGKGSRASWAWSSIIEGRDWLLKGMSWRVGNGESINLWKDRWIPKFRGGRLSIDDADGLHDFVLVKDIIEEGRWCLDEVEQWLLPSEVFVIKRIPLPLGVKEDSLVWAASNNGIYSIKSEYHFFQGFVEQGFCAEGWFFYAYLFLGLEVALEVFLSS